MRLAHSRRIPRQEVGEKKSSWLEGSSQVMLLLGAALFFVLGGMYIFAVNERAVYGYDMRTLEKEITQLKKDNAELRLREAEGRSLTKVEMGSATLRMEVASPSRELVITGPGSVAYR